MHKLEEPEFNAEFFPSNEISINNDKEEKFLLEEINKKQMYFNIELIIENTIKINSNEIQGNFQYKQLPIEIDMIKLEIPVMKIDNENNNILEEKNSSNEFYFIVGDLIKNLENKLVLQNNF